MNDQAKAPTFKLEKPKEWLQWSYIMKLHFTTTKAKADIFHGVEKLENIPNAGTREKFLKLERSMKIDLMRSLGVNYASKLVSIERFLDQWEMLQSIVIGDKHSRLERVKQNLFRMKWRGNLQDLIAYFRQNATELRS